MSNNSDTTPPKDTETPVDQEALSKAQLDEIFAQWDEKRHVHDEEKQFEREEVQEQLNRMAEVKAAAEAAIIKRAALLFLMIAVTVTTFYFFRDDILFFFESDDDVIELGDVRQRWCAAHRYKNPEKNAPSPVEDLKHNRIVRMENVIPTTLSRSDDGKRNYFFDPMLKTIVMTRRPLPPKYSMMGGMRSGIMKGSPAGPVNIESSVKLPQCLESLVLDRWLFARLAVYGNGFSGQGRLLKAEDAPNKYQGAIELYRAELRLSERMGDQQLWLFIDEEKPSRYTPHVVVYAAALLMIMLTFFFFIRARKRLTAIRDELTASGFSSST